MQSNPHHTGHLSSATKPGRKTAIVIASFGSATRAGSALDIFDKQVALDFPGHERFHACTSEIIREKTGHPNLLQVLEQVKAAGYQTAVVQPLYIFPGTEYQRMETTCKHFKGLRIFMGQTLLHHRSFIKQALKVLEPDFLPQDRGINLLALHGTPLAANPVNILYQGVEEIVTNLYSNVLAAAIEGLPDPEAMFARIKKHYPADRFRQARIIPIMYFAGKHARDDLMGPQKSWRRTLENMGFKVECPTVQTGESQCFKGLAHHPQLIHFLSGRLAQAMARARK